MEVKVLYYLRTEILGLPVSRCVKTGNMVAVAYVSPYPPFWSIFVKTFSEKSSKSVIFEVGQIIGLFEEHIKATRHYVTFRATGRSNRWHEPI